ncbi:MAG: LysR substrate-binding domain-containing protein [Gluconobacter potus]
MRAGALADSDMAARSLGVMEEVTVASPDYLAQHGMPATPEDFEGHQMIGFVSSRTGQPLPLEFMRGDEVIEVMLPTRLLVSGAETGAAAARQGFGLVQAPRYRFIDDFANGTLIEVLADFPPTPTPLSVLYPSNRQLSPRIRVFVDWVMEVIGPRLHPGA